MQLWTLAAIVLGNIVMFTIHDEDACVIAGKKLTKTFAEAAVCVDAIEGRVLFFKSGKQTDEDGVEVDDDDKQ